jgi:catechol 2,3-dioxygenase-like lactoylglutathione lyase family enzyme
VDAWPRGIDAITLFIDDLEATKHFYREVFGLPLKFEDDDSAVFDFGNTVINLLKATAARELIEPAVMASREAGSRLQLTIASVDSSSQDYPILRIGNGRWPGNARRRRR